MKTTNAVQAARKHIQKAAQKHMKSHQRQPSLDFSVQSSEDGHALHFRKDLDTISQDSRNGEISPLVQGPAAKAAFHKGAMSEPVRRAHRVKIHEPPETRRGIFSRMSSTDSHNMGAAPCVIADSFDLETSCQASCPDSPAPESQNTIQEELENQLNEPPESNCAEQDPAETFEPEQPEPPEEPSAEPEPDTEIVTEPEQPPEIQIQTDSLPQPQPVSHPENKSPPLIPPPSPARVRRTLEAPAISRPSTPIRTKARSCSCPRKQTTSQTPMVNRKPASHWRTQHALNYGSYQVRPIPNGLCLSDSTCSSSDSSIDSLEFVPSCVPVVTEQHEGTLQREMKALFDQKMREIRCKSPLFLDGESSMICDLHLQNMKNTKVRWLC